MAIERLRLQHPPAFSPATGLTLLVVGIIWAEVSSIPVALSAQSTAGQVQPELPKNAPTPIGRGANSPEEALFECYYSILTGDVERLKNVSDQSEGPDWDNLVSLANFGQQAGRFREEFIAVYGRQKWDQFNNPNFIPVTRGASAGANGSVTVVEVADILRLTRQAIKNQNGDTSWVSIPNTDDARMLLVRRNEKWYFSAATVIPLEGQQKRAAMEQLDAFGKQLPQFQAVIGAEGVTPNDIDAELGRVMLESGQVMRFSSEHRFDLAKLTAANRAKREKRSGQFQVVKDKMRQRALTIFQGAANGSPQPLFDSLHPSLKPLLPVERTTGDLKAIASALGLDSIAIECVEQPTFVSDANSLRVVGRVPTDDGIALFQLFVQDDYVVGLQVETTHFVFDSRNIERPVPGMVEAVEPLATAMFSGQPKKAYQLMPKRYKQAKQIESFKIKFRFLLEAGLKNITIIPEQTRVTWPPTEGQGLQLTDLRFGQSIEAGNARRWVCRSVFSISEQNRFELSDFDIAADMPSYHSQSDANAMVFLEALGANDVEKIVALFPPQMQKNVERPVLAAFLLQMSRHLGEFEGVDQTQWFKQSRLEDGQFTAKVEGEASFSNQKLEFLLQSEAGFLLSFNLFGLPADLSFVSKIEDKDHYLRQGEGLLRAMASGEFERGFAMLPASLLEDAGEQRQQFTDQVAGLTAGLGALNSVKSSSAELIDDEYWRFHYTLEFENGRMLGWVEFEFSPLQGSIISFNLRPNESD